MHFYKLLTLLRLLEATNNNNLIKYKREKMKSFNTIDVKKIREIEIEKLKKIGYIRMLDWNKIYHYPTYHQFMYIFRSASLQEREESKKWKIISKNTIFIHKEKFLEWAKNNPRYRDFYEHLNEFTVQPRKKEEKNKNISDIIQELQLKIENLNEISRYQRILIDSFKEKYNFEKEQNEKLQFEINSKMKESEKVQNIGILGV